jgi:muramoyltetrapeptide carboxypeptidase
MAEPRSQPATIKPTRLRRGDTIGIIAPASAITRDSFEVGCRGLEAFGYKPFFLDSIFDRDLYFAGSLERRIREIEEMFARDDVSAILCARGGYGCNYLLGGIDLDLLRRNPKPLIGYSDVTTLLTWLHDATGLVTFHGPMLIKDFGSPSDVDERSWAAVLGGDPTAAFGTAEGLSGLRSGSAEGVLYGGCLSLIAASIGTPYEVRTEGRILFFEDIAAKPYQIDRMLMQLKIAGKLDRVRGIIFGEMIDCVQPGGQQYTLQEVVLRVVGDPGVPVAYGLRSGHVSRQNITLPIGVRATLRVDGENAALELNEASTARPTTNDRRPTTTHV